MSVYQDLKIWTIKTNNMKLNKFISVAVVATLALTSCENREEQWLEDRINSCNVKAMTGIKVTTTAISTCTGRDTSWVNQFASCYVVNIGALPEVDDVNIDTYEFYAMLNNKKVTGSEAMLDKLDKTCEGIVYNAVFSQFSVQDLNIVIPIEDLNSAEFYVETPNNIRKLTLNEIY